MSKGSSITGMGIISAIGNNVAEDLPVTFRGRMVFQNFQN